MPHATMGSQTNVASMEFKFSAQHYTVIPYTVILANWSLLALPKLEFHSLKSPLTFGSYHGHLWLARNALEARCCPETNKNETSVHAVHAVHDRSALGTGLRPWHWELPWATSKTQHCHTLHRPSLRSGFKHVSYFSFLWNASRWMMWRFHFSCLDGEDYPSGRICLLYTCILVALNNSSASSVSA